MANICSTYYVVYGKDKAMDTLIKAFDDIEATSNLKDVPVLRLVEALGITDTDDLPLRGHITYTDIKNDDVLGMVLRFEIESAWSPLDETIDAIKYKLNDGISVSYKAEECGCGVFVIHDEHDFFPENYLVSAGGIFKDEWEYYEKLSDVFNVWCEATGESRGKMTDDEMLEYIDNYEYDDEDTFFNIYKFGRE